MVWRRGRYEDRWPIPFELKESRRFAEIRLDPGHREKKRPAQRTGRSRNAIDDILTGFLPIRRRQAVGAGRSQLFSDPIRPRPHVHALSGTNIPGGWDARHRALGRITSTVSSVVASGLEDLQQVYNLLAPQKSLQASRSATGWLTTTLPGRPAVSVDEQIPDHSD